MLATYFERMKAAAERHGGVVEKFIGDAVMAVFGVPAVHEDDALRALRAALEMREAIVELGMEGRIGVESGEVVVGTGERLVTGRAVDDRRRGSSRPRSRARSWSASGRCSSPATACVAERARAARAQGQARAGAGVAAAVGLGRGARARRFDSPFVGRERELETLDEAWERACAERALRARDGRRRRRRRQVAPRRRAAVARRRAQSPTAAASRTAPASPTGPCSRC